MKKRTITLPIIVVIIILLEYKTKIYIPCIIHELTSLYCPGCGVTRMVMSIIKLDFYQAFRYNPLVFILLPFFTVLLIDYIIPTRKDKKYLYQKVNDKVWITIIVFLVLFGILRNFFPILAPTKI